MPYDYSKEYREAAFYIWYKNGKPGARNAAKIMPDEEGHKPDWSTVNNWMKHDGWIERADALDAEVSIKLDREMIQSRADQLRRMAEVGEETMNEGYKYIKEQGFDSAAAAVRAIGMGSDMVFRYAGAAEGLVRVLSMTDQQLEKEVAKLLGKDDFIDAETVDVPADDIEKDNAENDNE